MVPGTAMPLPSGRPVRVGADLCASASCFGRMAMGGLVWACFAEVGGPGRWAQPTGEQS